MSKPISAMDRNEFMNHLTANYGDRSYGLQVFLEAERRSVKAPPLTLRVTTPAAETVPAAVAAPEPVIAAPVVQAAPPAEVPAADLHDLGRRWQAGEKISRLAKETGRVWNKLWSELDKLGYRPNGTPSVN